MKYRQKAEKVEAIQVRFGTRSWPSWLEGHVGLTGEGGRPFENGDYIVGEADGSVTVYSEEQFQAKFEQVRQPREKNGD